MNIGEYINERLADVRFYLRGIHFNDLESERLVERLREDVSDFFNNNPLYRKETKKFICDIKGMYETLRDHELEFATTKKEVDDAILKFEVDLKQRMVEFKNRILLLFKQNNNCESIMLNNSMDEVKVKIRSRKDKKTMEEMHENKELLGFWECFVIIYIFMTYIANKSTKLEEMKDKISENYTPRTAEYLNAMANYMELKYEKNYDKFIDLYDAKTSELFSKSGRVRS